MKFGRSGRRKERETSSVDCGRTRGKYQGERKGKKEKKKCPWGVDEKNTSPTGKTRSKKKGKHRKTKGSA